MNITRFLSVIIFIISLIKPAYAEYNLDFKTETMSNMGEGDFAPFLMASNSHGIITQPFSALAKLDIHRKQEPSKRFSIGYGITILGGYSSKISYSIYDSASSIMINHDESPSTAWIQQLYFDIKYRSLFMSLGAKESGSKMLNDRLSSGDMTWSANARPMPGVRTGFINPQSIPFTNDWVQISGEIGYFKQTDDKWLENHYNYLNNFITTDLWFNYKYCYFHTKPSQPFSITIGMQAACQFGGKKRTYLNGDLQESVDMHPDLGTFFRSFIPGPGGGNSGDQTYYEGNHVGSWDIMGRYRLKNGSELKAYYQSPWEDGSGIGMMNGFDGLYGLEYKSSCENSIVTGAVVEYLDLTNQGGPIHWAPGDFPGTPIANEATGADNYYNNYAYNGYQYYGMSIGSPVLKSPLYNKDGYMAFTDTRLRSINAGIEGKPFKSLVYRAKFSYTESKGTIFKPYSKIRSNISFMLECVYSLRNIPGLELKGLMALDKGELYGDNAGLLLSVSYRGLLKL